MRISLGAMMLLLVAAGSGTGQCALPEHLDKYDLVFLYVHGFGETRAFVPFEEKMREFLAPLPLKATVATYRWDWVVIDPTKVVHQWTEAKAKADREAKTLIKDLKILEEAKVNYVIVGFSLGCRVVAGALNEGGAGLKHLKGIYFMGAALPHDFEVPEKSLPAGMKITSYFSSDFDYVLKVTFYNAEGTAAGGEAGFDDTRCIQNFRTVCTHVHKGGAFQRDYANLAEAIGMITLFRAGIFVKGAPASWNMAMPVMAGDVHWNDFIEFPDKAGRMLIQQNANTGHYRAVSEDKNGKRVRQAWGKNLHSVMQAVQMFPGPYQQVITDK